METGQVVAIKRIRLDDSHLGDVEELMVGFISTSHREPDFTSFSQQKEVDLLQSLSHPNIVHYEGFIRTDEVLNIILEFVENVSLLNLLKTFGTMPERLVVNYVVKMCEGLDYLHERGVVHCDLKAANILTTKNGEVKLSDFGVSKQLNVLDKNTQAVGEYS